MTVAIGASPSPSPSSPGIPPINGGQIVHGVWREVSGFASHHPGLATVVIAILLATFAESMRVAIHTGPKDPIRRFSRSDRSFILNRAGQRCEHHGLIGRCRVTKNLEADHIHPHSRGGWTRVENGQALCRAHNREKRAFVPYDFQLRRLERRRIAYLPPGVPMTVIGTPGGVRETQEAVARDRLSPYGFRPTTP